MEEGEEDEESEERQMRNEIRKYECQKSLVGRGVAGEGLRGSMDPHRMGRYIAEVVRMAGIHEEER